MRIHSLLAFLWLSFSTQLSGETEITNDWLKAVQKRDTGKIGELIPNTQNINQKTNKGLTALMAAAARGDDAIVHQLLIKKAKPNLVNNRGGSALMYSAALNHLKTINLLIKYGAKINLRAENGWTALTLAAAKGNKRIIKKLLASGANPNIPDVYGWTALMRAIQHGRIKSANLLTRHRNTQINRINNKGQSALHVAAATNQCETIKLLIDHGADIRLQNFKDQTPLQNSQCSTLPIDTTTMPEQ